MRTHAVVAHVLPLFAAACTTPPPKPAEPAPAASASAAASAAAGAAGSSGASAPASAATFDDDVAFLKAHGEVVVLESPAGGRVALSPSYQGRVMTSAVGPGGASLGWIHRRFIEAGKTGTQFDNYGGEDRFWLGPEGGQYGLYFAPGKPYAFDAWQTPAAFQEGAWVAKSSTASGVTFARSLALDNHAGTHFALDVTRTVELLGAADVEQRLGGPLPAGVKWVAFESQNRITNTGKTAWKEDGGLLSVWILAMFPPTDDTFVVVPFERKGEGAIVHDSYFGKVPADRLAVHAEEGYLVFRCDGHHRSKIGLGPSRALSVLGSYAPSAKLLTLVQYDKPPSATRYVNSMWEEQKEPYGGDVVNSYNDGPTEPGKPALGGFYEMETSSPAAALAPGASLSHVHRTFHLVGEPAALDAIAERVLGVAVTKLAAER